MILGMTCVATVRIGHTKGMGSMGTGENLGNGPQFKTGPLITSAVMVGAGTLIALTGLGIGAAYVVSATREWIDEMEVAPTELARMKWTQARAAMAAGAAAWQDGTTSDPSRPGPAIR